MGTVETVRGPVEASELGRTLAHEHILIIEPEALQNWGHVYGPCYWDEEVRVADAIARLKELREAGIRTIIDPTAPGLGRHIPRVQRINESVDLNIVVASGLYAFLALPNFLTYRDVDAIAELFVRELLRGDQRPRAAEGRVPQVRRRGARCVAMSRIPQRRWRHRRRDQGAT